MPERPILVAGKSGQLARCLRDAAVLRNVPIVAVGRPELDLEGGQGIDRVMAAVEPSAIVNAAAYTAVDRAEAEPGRAFAVNCGGAELLADAAARRGIAFIQISTDFVFDGSKRSPYREDDVPAPLNVYGASKLASETAVLKACPGAAVIRTSWVYSPYGNNFVRTMLRLSEEQPVGEGCRRPARGADVRLQIWPRPSCRSSNSFGRPTAVKTLEFITSPVTVKRVGMDLPRPSSRASPGVGDVSRDCRPSRRQSIQLQLVVPNILAWTH